MPGRPGVGNSGASNLKKGGTPPQGPENVEKIQRTKRAKKEGAEIARDLVSDPQYRKKLRQRLRDGTAGPIENLLWLMAYGKPKEMVGGADAHERMRDVRQAATKAIKEGKPQLALVQRVPVIDVPAEASTDGEP